MKGYHYLLRMAHCMNTLVEISVHVAEWLARSGFNSFLTFIWETLRVRSLDLARIQAVVRALRQLRFA